MSGGGLDRFQVRLLEILSRPIPARKMLSLMKRDPDLKEFHDYIDTFELRMVEVAGELVKKWGRREG